MHLKNKKRLLSGIQPSGALHLGNYFAMLRPCIDTQDDHQVCLCIADHHALTQSPSAEDLRQRTQRLILDCLALGVDPDKSIFFRQSDVHEVLELNWILSCLTPMGLLERSHSYKDKLAQGLSPSHGLFSYPVLMSADILLYKAQAIPVGKDQSQHLEITRDIAQRFNKKYGPIFLPPESQIQQNMAAIPGIDGRKMSKSYNNTIEVFAEPKQIRKKFMKIVTDTSPIEAPKNPDTCTLFALYSLFASSEEKKSMREHYQSGGIAYGEVKQEAFQKYFDYFQPLYERRQELAQSPSLLEDSIQNGSKKAQAIAKSTLEEVYYAIGIR